MPKTPSNKLFRLIKSLSGSEKRYFKIFVGDKDNKYIQLFDEIEVQKEFDDEVLRETIYNGKPIQSRKYSELKAYLYDLILKSLQSYDEKSSVDYRLKGMLLSVRAMYKRALFEDGKDLLGKAWKLATKYEKFKIMLEILDWEKQLAYANTDIAFLDSELDRIVEQETLVLDKINRICYYRNSFYRLLVSIRKNSSHLTTAQNEVLKKQVEEIEYNPEDPAGSYHAKVHYYRTYTLYYYAQSDFENFYQIGKQLIQLMESKPYFLQEDVSEYISALSNFMRSCGELSKFEELEENLEKFYQITPKTRDDELKIHRQYYQVKFSLCIHKGEFEEGIDALKKHLKERQKFDQHYFENNTFYFNYFYINFGAGNYDDALLFLNKWLNLSRTVERQDLQSLARILNLIIHYEMGNTLLLDSLLRSTYRFLNKRNSLYEFEEKVIRFIREASKIQSRSELKEVFDKLKKEFIELAETQPQTALLHLFDMGSWLDSKIQNRSFPEVVKEKFSRHMAKKEA